MKKITLFLVAVLFSFAADAQITLTQSIDPENVTDGGVACWDNVSFEYRNNSFWRSYDLADFGVSGDFEISEVQWGQGTADANNVLTLNIYVVDSEDLFLATEYELIASTTHNSDPANDLSVVTESLSATIPAGSIIAFEVNSPDGGAATDVRFFPGYNTAGENAPCYLQSADCGINFPTTPADVGGFPDSYVMNIIGEEVPLSIGDNLSEYIAVYPTPADDVLNVKVPSYIQVTGVTLHDILGKNTGVTYSNGSIDVSNLSRGVYLLTVETNEGTLTQKVVKK
ncbi:T9SS type A sorting domain-containing protein [Planktosalinus lacus]|uniref:Secretion system C-terminal sorting domain-containing protein n=1 Tax=Planktosalinus lacus TaxID=1526573 RepID=A0A8J2V989_9FLAO|nr:T9SS type A sorting domain-containing protein [Planktosalinus lacus]GGD88860.1 hypothetical protein GCM10011312_10900 [Planktosalinus lacus]